MNHSYESECVKFAQVRRAAHLRVPIAKRSAARARRECPLRTERRLIVVWGTYLFLMFVGVCLVFSPWFVRKMFGG